MLLIRQGEFDILYTIFGLEHKQLIRRSVPEDALKEYRIW